ncbi:MAG TPA: DNA translocase FtsK 4TM domain-containing protein, partial [Thermoanaerobaculia bacterium]
MQLAEFFRSRRGGELVGIVILAMGISAAAALVTYHPNDSSAFYTSTDVEIRNAIGYYGATLAWIFVSFFGFASLLFPGVLLAAGWNRFWGRDIEYFHTKLIGFVILALAMPPLFDLAVGKIWLRGALIAAGGYLGQEINRAISGNLNTSGAVIALVTAMLVGILLATRISLAAVFLAIHQQSLALGRTISMHWARFSERRRKERMKEAIVRKHLEKAEPPQLRLVSSAPEEPSARGPIVREVQGRGSFQIRKVTKADLRKAAEALAQQETPNPFELYVAPPAPLVIPSVSEGPGRAGRAARPARPARPGPSLDA